jgi:hypothetical protein
LRGKEHLRRIVTVFADDVLDAANGEVVEDPAELELDDNVGVGHALALELHDEVDLLGSVSTGADHFCGWWVVLGKEGCGEFELRGWLIESWMEKVMGGLRREGGGGYE